MLRRGGASLLGLEQRLGTAAASAAYATASKDYAVAMKQAADLIKPSESSISPKEVGLTAGVPLETFSREARIYSPCRTPSQSGLARTAHPSSGAPAWKVEFENQAKWVNPLMGWTSTADPLENVGRASLFFYTKEEAISFCTKHGWGYSVEEPNARRTTRQKRYTAYADNFSIKRKGLPDLSTLPSNR